MQEESPEGGRFKKEIVLDGHSYLLLIRDEGGPPELQVCLYATVILVNFSPTQARPASCSQLETRILLNDWL